MPNRVTVLPLQKLHRIFVFVDLSLTLHSVLHTCQQTSPSKKSTRKGTPFGKIQDLLESIRSRRSNGPSQDLVGKQVVVSN
jgi:hypothetical protein